MEKIYTGTALELFDAGSVCSSEYYWSEFSDIEIIRAALQYSDDHICNECAGTNMAFADVVEAKQEIEAKYKNLQSIYQSSLDQIRTQAAQLRERYAEWTLRQQQLQEQEREQ